ncbi:MAG: putative porin [Pseudomonadota bacterium]
MAKYGLAQCAFAALLAGTNLANAQVSEETAQLLLKELQALKQEQNRISGRIEAIERQLGAPIETAGQTPIVQTATIPPNIAPSAPQAPAPVSKVNVSGDFLLRFEGNYSNEDAEDRNRGVLRARLRGAYAPYDFLTVAGLLETGDPDDPNSGYQTLSDFGDDLDISLSQIYAQFTFGDLSLYGGKIPRPFISSDIVWDGDVYPEGAAFIYERDLADAASLRATGIFFVVDEDTAGADSYMAGGQVALSVAPTSAWRAQLAAAYFDYTLDSIDGADGGDLRSNLLQPDGSYLSDFDLLDLILDVRYTGLGERWPLQLKADYVKNIDSTSTEDTGYGADIFVGRLTERGDTRFGLGYAAVETDAVLAAFSNDNLTIATNYEVWEFVFDILAQDRLKLNATWYHYKPLDAAFAGADDPNDWLDRIRLNMSVSF